MTKGNTFRCNYCGKFVGYDSDFTSDFIPDNEFGPEQFCLHCEKCTKLHGNARC